jgi:translation initiation factor 5B
VDDRTEEEILADQLAAELEAEFADEEDAGESADAADVESAKSSADAAAKDATEKSPAKDPAKAAEELAAKKKASEERAGQQIEVSQEALEKAKAMAKKATEGDAEKAIGALAAKSDTAYTRHPIVSVLGHVDHGKTSILDRVRGTHVFEREAGAITQHIGASEVPLEVIYERCGPLLKSKKFGVPGLLFIDTPGHHAFTSLRSRGGQLADIAILVVDLNEGFKPQTLESLNILRRSKTPFVVAANKVDRIEGWKSSDRPFILGVKEQDPKAIAHFDDRFYRLVGTFFDQGLPAERYDRISDFRKQIAIVPTSAKTGEGIPDLLAMLVGLAQKFLEERLVTDEEMPGAGTVLEVKEDKGLGTTLDVILYAGAIRSGDRILLGTPEGPHETTIRALLKPAALDEMRDAREDFVPVDEVVAAAGIKLVAPSVERVVSGAPLRVLRGDNDDVAWEEVESALQVRVTLSDKGVYVKADTIGSLEALANEFKSLKIPIRKAEVGDISRRDVVEAATMTEPLHRAILGFNVKMLPEVEKEAHERELPVFTDRVIYSLVEDYNAWVKKTKAALEAAQRQDRVHPAKVKFLSGCSFRQRDPAVFGVRVLAGEIMPGRALVRSDGKVIGRIRSIQKENQSVQRAKLGDEVALSVPGPTLGRQIKEEDILYMDIPEGDAKWLLLQGKLTPEERDVLMELVKTKRKEERFWAM